MRRTDEHTESAAPASSRGSAENNRLSLEDVHGSVDVPHHQAGFWEQWRAFVGPAVLVSVGYMDPGQLGDGPARRCSVQIRALVGCRTSQPDGDLHASNFRSLGCTPKHFRQVAGANGHLAHQPVGPTSPRGIPVSAALGKVLPGHLRLPEEHLYLGGCDREKLGHPHHVPEAGITRDQYRCRRSPGS